jgi:hypothetical protein
MKAMEISKELLKASNVFGRDGVSMNDIATGHKGRETLYKLSGNMAINCHYVNL